MSYLNYLKSACFKNHPLKNDKILLKRSVKSKNWFLNYYDYSKIDKWALLRETAKSYDANVQIRLEWMIFYEKISGQNALSTSIHFSISPKTFHKWHQRFIYSNNNLESLMDKSKAPKNKRISEITDIQVSRIIHLRKTHLRYGRMKIQKLYLHQFNEPISTWKIECVIRNYKLYPDKIKHTKTVNKKARGRKTPKIRIMSYLRTTPNLGVGSLWHTDSIILYYEKFKRAIITAIDEVSRIGYARVYSSASSKNAEDFLYRLNYLAEGTVNVMHMDNGSEFEGLFRKACEKTNVKQIFSRVRTPNDNPKNERFNRTIQEEWLEDTDVDMQDIYDANRSLTEWLIEYNTKRPHESLSYDTPVEYVEKILDNEVTLSSSKVLPMLPVGTVFVSLLFVVVYYSGIQSIFLAVSYVIYNIHSMGL